MARLDAARWAGALGAGFVGGTGAPLVARVRHVNDEPRGIAEREDAKRRRPASGENPGHVGLKIARQDGRHDGRQPRVEPPLRHG